MAGHLGQIGFFDSVADLPKSVFADKVSAFLNRCDLQYFSFVQLQAGRGAKKLRDLNLHTNYQGPWVERYITRRYDQLDPVCDLGRQATAPFWWGGSRFLSDFEKRQRRVFWEAADFGIHYGVTIPVRSMDGALSLVSYTAGTASDIRNILDEAGPQLHVAAHQIADRLVERDPATFQEDNPLTPRERESLIWVVQGMTSEEIADRMLLSVSAVNYHLGKATRKLDARNRHHAALLALSQQLI